MAGNKKGEKVHLIHVGFNGVVDMERVVAVAGTMSAAPTKTLVQRARDRGALVDMTRGRKSKSAIITKDNRVILVPLASATIAGRFGTSLKEVEIPEEEEEDSQHIGGSTTLQLR